MIILFLFSSLWAPFWYDQVHLSTGFNTMAPTSESVKPSEEPLYPTVTAQQLSVYREALPFFNFLHRFAIGIDPLSPGENSFFAFLCFSFIYFHFISLPFLSFLFLSFHFIPFLFFPFFSLQMITIDMLSSIHQLYFLHHLFLLSRKTICHVAS